MRIILSIIFLFSFFSSNAQKTNLILYVGTQSNGGTDPATGRIDSTQCPDYMKTEFSNVYFLDIGLTGGTNTSFFAPYQPGVNAFGWIDQMLYILSKTYKNIFVIKRGVGGTKLATRVGGSSYPRSDFTNRATSGRNILATMIDTTDADKAFIWEQCESDALLQADADIYGKNLVDWFKMVRDTTGITYPIFIKRISDKTKDFPYRSTVQAKQDSVAAAYPLCHIINTDSITHKGTFTGASDPNTEAGDFSHYNLSGAFAVGRKFADSILSVFNRKKDDVVKPVLTKATINNAGTLLTLKFSEQINPAIVPFSKQFIVGTKVFSSVVVNGSTIELTPTVPFYSGQTYTFRYAKDSLFKMGVQDLQGNELNAIAAYQITNGASSAEPTLTTNYTSNFSAGVDGFSAASGGTITGIETSTSGVTNCLKVVCTSTTQTNIQKTVSPSFTSGQTYRVEFDVEMPESYRYPSMQGFYFQFKVPTGTLRQECVRFLNRDKMCHVEVQFTMSSNAGTCYIQCTGLVNDIFWIKNFIVKKVG